MKMSKALEMLDEFVDPSDPDMDVPNSIHAYQTAERIRNCYSDKREDNIYYWICGLIHDIGKVLFKFKEKSWGIVGDTYVVCCKFPESIVYYDTMKENRMFGMIQPKSKRGEKPDVYKVGCLGKITSFNETSDNRGCWFHRFAYCERLY